MHAVRESGQNISLDLALSDGAVTANTLKEVGAYYDSLVDAKVRLRGNAAPLFNHQLQMTGVHLFFPNRAQVTVEEPAPADPFTLPVSPVSGLLRFTPDSASHHRVHIRGTVTLAWPGRLLCIQDGLHGLCAQTDQTTPLRPGRAGRRDRLSAHRRIHPELDACYLSCGGLPAAGRCCGRYRRPGVCAAITTRGWWNCKASLLGRTSLQVTRTSCCLPGIMCFPLSCPHNPERSGCPPGKKEPPSK